MNWDCKGDSGLKKAKCSREGEKEGRNSMKVQIPFLVVGVEQKILHERRTSELRIQKDTPSTAKC